MPSHIEKKILPYPSQFLYEIVKDVEKYPEFVPWCQKIEILEKKSESMLVDLTVGYKIFQETYTSRITLFPESKIYVEQEKGPFKYLKNTWEFREHPSGCELVFEIDFEFKYRLLQSVVDKVFMELMHLMIRSFELRARMMYRVQTKNNTHSEK